MGPIPAASFLFVNKDVNSSSYSNNYGERVSHAKITSHVQRTLRQRSNIKATRQPKKKLPLTKDIQSAKPIWLRGSSGEGWARDEATSDDDAASISPPRAAVDSVCSPLFSLDSSTKSMIRYYDGIWMPSDSTSLSYAHGRQLCSFTAVLDSDLQLPKNVIRDAIQSNYNGSLYAVLSAAARRMVVTRSAEFSKDMPDYLSLKAIQSLRSLLSKETQLPDPGRLILDLSYMTIHEAFSATPSRTDIHFKIMRKVVVDSGGFESLPPFYCLMALTSDIRTATSALVVPILNPFDSPSLVGLTLDADVLEDVKDALIRSRFLRLDARLRNMLEASGYVSHIIRAISQLPPSGAEGLLPYTSFSSKFWNLLYYTLTPASSVIQQNPEDAMITYEADALLSLIRFMMGCTWMWYYALDCTLRHKPGMEVATPKAVSCAFRQMWKQTDKVYHLIDDTVWTIPHHVFFWIAALGFLASKDETDRTEYTSLMCKIATIMGIKHHDELKEIFDRHLPLECVHPAPSYKIWTIIMEQRAAI
jgi:hypothetical protein